jgi:hypothetical protein
MSFPIATLRLCPLFQKPKSDFLMARSKEVLV